MGPLARRFFARLIRHGTLVVIDPRGERHEFGDGSGETHTIKLMDDKVLREVVAYPELRFAELYMDGRWFMTEGSLTGLLTMVFRNMAREPASSRWRIRLRKLLRRIQQHNTARVARRNATHHYDVGNDIYALFLDEDWQYSCAYFADPDMSLEEAQVAKKRHIAAKLMVERGHSVLDIGSGWGGMALYLADNLGADVTGITLADEQARGAGERAAGRSDVRFNVTDYRSVERTFDRIVSIGMFEHVGLGFYDAYFDACRRMMADDGVMLLHTIGRSGVPGYTAPFIAKYIFPGGYVPSLSEVLPAIERAGLFVTDVEIWRLHYAETLKHWLERFRDARSRVIALRGEHFYRMWEFYLASCEAAFRAGDTVVFQIQIAKSLDTVPLTRDYIAAAEGALAARDTGQRRSPALVAQRG